MRKLTTPIKKADILDKLAMLFEEAKAEYFADSTDGYKRGKYDAYIDLLYEVEIYVED